MADHQKDDPRSRERDIYEERALERIRQEEHEKYLAVGAYQTSPSPYPRPTVDKIAEERGVLRTPDQWVEDVERYAADERARDAADGRDRNAEHAEDSQTHDHHARDDFNRVGEDRRDEPEHENHALKDEREDGAVEQNDRGEQFSENAQDVTERHPIEDYGWSSDPDRDDDRGW